MRSPFNDFAGLWNQGALLKPNSYFGMLNDNFITNEQDLVDAINGTVVRLEVSDISLFEIDSENNVRCNISKSYDNNTGTMNGEITFYYDFEGLLNDYAQSFNRGDQFERVIGYSDGNLINQCFRLTSLEYAILPNISNSDSNGNFGQMQGNLKRVYLPNWENFTTNQFLFGGSYSSSALNSVWYFKKNMETVDNGSPHPSIVFTTNQGSIQAVFIDNTDKPNAVNDLSVSNITSSSVQLDFTAPTVNTNANDFYYVYIRYNGISFKFDYNTDHEISAFYDEITGSGDTITGLPSGTTIDIQVQTVDIYHNVSGYSNKVTFQTL